MVSFKGSPLEVLSYEQVLCLNLKAVSKIKILKKLVRSNGPDKMGRKLNKQSVVRNQKVMQI